MLLDAGAATGWVDFHNVLAVHKEQPIPNAMALLATEPHLKDKWHTFLEKNRAREERSKNMSAMDLLPYINVKAGDQVCRSIEGVWVRGVVVQRPGKTHEKPRYDGFCSALPVGANVVI